jgi:hypothetical protein
MLAHRERTARDPGGRPGAAFRPGRIGPTRARPVPAALTPAAITALDGRLDPLVRLAAVRDADVLTDDEYRSERDCLLGV